MPACVRPAVEAALARAVVYRVLSIGLQAPTAGRLHEASADERFASLSAALEYLRYDSDGGGPARAAEQLAALAPQDVERVTAQFVHLFGHTARGKVSACETEYGPDNLFHQPQQLADIAGYYLAFGL